MPKKTRNRRSSGPRRPLVESPVGAFDQSLKYLLHKRPGDFIGFALRQPQVQVLRPLEAALPAQGREVDGAYLIQIGSERWVSHTEFHRRHQALDSLALDVSEAQLRLFRRERLRVFSQVWDLYGSASDPVLEERELRIGAPLSQSEGSCCSYTRVNLRGLAWEELLTQAPPALWALAPLTRDGASAVAVHQVRDVIEGQQRLSEKERADQLAILWFMAEAEGAPGAMIRQYLTREKLMESELYRSILNEGIEKGLSQGIEKGLSQGIEKGRIAGLKEGTDNATRALHRQTIATLLVNRLGYLSDDVRVRLESENSLLVLAPWYNQALNLSDEAAAQRLADHIRRAPLPQR